MITMPKDALISPRERSRAHGRWPWVGVYSYDGLLGSMKAEGSESCSTEGAAMCPVIMLLFSLGLWPLALDKH